LTDRQEWSSADDAVTALFEIGIRDVADTGDDWYTPSWLFGAAALTFDIDVAAPVNPARRTCPARTYLTPVDDGLTHPWHGIVWCNPPYSGPAPWVTRFVAHSDGLMLVPAARSRWLGTLIAAADAIAPVSCEFGRPDGSRVSPGGMVLILAARGTPCVAALTRVAAADRLANGAYQVRPA
jgi:hypothetical protein